MPSKKREKKTHCNEAEKNMNICLQITYGDAFSSECIIFPPKIPNNVQ